MHNNHVDTKGPSRENEPIRLIHYGMGLQCSLGGWKLENMNDNKADLTIQVFPLCLDE